MGNTEIELENKYFNYLVSTRNLLEGSSVVDLLSYPVDYTSIINLNELLQKRDKIRYYKADYTIKVGIIYVKSGGRIAENITFTPFYFDKDGNLLDKSFQMTINDEVEVEYADGCIRLFPLIPDITECIIQHCFVVCDGLL
ncbi:MAG: hypothetical protein HUJ56_04760 [Erysipelotrichaceae bacterium]|nr:hypothetical protein [Erysipelotrichaceae bacterium]